MHGVRQQWDVTPTGPDTNDEATHRPATHTLPQPRCHCRTGACINSYGSSCVVDCAGVRYGMARSGPDSDVPSAANLRCLSCKSWFFKMSATRNLFLSSTIFKSMLSASRSRRSALDATNAHGSRCSSKSAGPFTVIHDTGPMEVDTHSARTVPYLAYTLQYMASCEPSAFFLAE